MDVIRWFIRKHRNPLFNHNFHSLFFFWCVFSFVAANIFNKSLWSIYSISELLSGEIFRNWLKILNFIFSVGLCETFHLKMWIAFRCINKWKSQFKWKFSFSLSLSHFLFLLVQRYFWNIWRLLEWLIALCSTPLKWWKHFQSASIYKYFRWLCACVWKSNISRLFTNAIKHTYP